MKINAAFVKSLLLVTSFGLVLPLLAKPPAKPAAAKQEEAAKPAGEEAEPTIPGKVIPRTKGGYLSLVVEDGSIKLTFYDAKKKQINADVARANVHWNPKYRKTEERHVFAPSGDGKTLVSSTIRPPYIFKAFLTLLNENDEAVENYVVDYP